MYLCGWTSKMIAFLLSVLPIAASYPYYAKTMTTTHPSGLLFNGKHIKINEAPFYVSIMNNDEAVCGGVILSPHYVLTAAHCRMNKVRAGSSLRNAEGTVHGVWSGTYPKNDPTYVKTDYEDWETVRYTVPANDLVLLRLSTPIEFNESRQPIRLFNESEDLGIGIDALVYGWDIVNGTEHLVTRTVSTLDVNLCDSAYEHVGGVAAGLICATYPGALGKSGCVGDSGGPLVIGGRLAGILSYGNGCIKPHYPGVYTEIAYYRRWIDQTIPMHDTNSLNE